MQDLDGLQRVRRLRIGPGVGHSDRNAQNVERAAALSNLAAIGYPVTAGAETAVVTAFQRRFRPERWDGRLDAETALRVAQVRAAYDRARRL